MDFIVFGQEVRPRPPKTVFANDYSKNMVAGSRIRLKMVCPRRIKHEIVSLSKSQIIVSVWIFIYINIYQLYFFFSYGPADYFFYVSLSFALTFVCLGLPFRQCLAFRCNYPFVWSVHEKCIYVPVYLNVNIFSSAREDKGLVGVESPSNSFWVETPDQ